MFIDFEEIDRLAEIRRTNLRNAANWLAPVHDWASSLTASLNYFSNLRGEVDKLDAEGRALLGIGTYARITEVATAVEQFKTRINYDGSKGNTGNLLALAQHVRNLK